MIKEHYLIRYNISHRCLDKAGQDDVHSYPKPSQLLGSCLGEPNHPSLGSRVVSLPDIPSFAHYARNVHDRAGQLLIFHQAGRCLK